MKTLGWFALRFTLLFGLIAWPWPALRQVTSAGFRAQARCLASVSFPRYACRVESCSDLGIGSLDTRMVLTDSRSIGPDRQPPALAILFDSGSQTWMPLAMWLALCLATPLPRSQCLKALLAGVLALQALLAGTILASISFNLAAQTLPAGPHRLLIFANRLLVENLWISFVPPFLLWVGWLAWGGPWEGLAVLVLYPPDGPAAKTPSRVLNRRSPMPIPRQSQRGQRQFGQWNNHEPSQPNPNP
jgi:hypothetical protein